jgi:hypothetical protein
MLEEQGQQVPIYAKDTQVFVKSCPSCDADSMQSRLSARLNDWPSEPWMPANRLQLNADET